MAWQMTAQKNHFSRGGRRECLLPLCTGTLRLTREIGEHRCATVFYLFYCWSAVGANRCAPALFTLLDAKLANAAGWRTRPLIQETGGTAALLDKRLARISR